MKKVLLAVLGFFGLGALLSRGKSPKPSGPDLDEPWPPPFIITTGDSYAVGVGAQMHNLFPNVETYTSATVGKPAAAMSIPTPKDDELYVLSAGTNDLAGSAPVEAVVEIVWRLLGQGDERIVYLLPSKDAGSGYLNERIRLFRLKMIHELQSLGQPYVDLPTPDAPDGVHYMPATYREIASQAVEAGR